MEPGKDHLTRRCPRLGGPIPFRYCRQCGDGGQPCRKVLDCWWEAFDIVAYMKGCLSPDQFEQFMQSPAKPKICSIVELIAEAKKRHAAGE